MNFYGYGILNILFYGFIYLFICSFFEFDENFILMVEGER